MSSSSTDPNQNFLCHALTPSSSSSLGTTILVVGGSGGTGPRVLQGLLDVGYRPDQIRLLTRNNNRPNMARLRQVGFTTVQADLDDDDADDDQEPTPLLQNAVKGCTGCYVHSTASDSVRLDTGEVDRARRLLAAIRYSHHHAAAAGGDDDNNNNHHVIRSIVYNSAAAEVGHGVDRIAQKHLVDQVFIDGSPLDNYYSYTSLRANLFMEELWKSYTRPSIVHKGKYPFSIPPDRQIYLTSVRDMGRLAGTILLRQQQQQQRENRIMNVAGDMLTPTEMAAAFGRAQGSKCVHNRGRLLEFIARLFFKDLYQIIRFYQTSTATTDISALRTEFPGLLTSFASFLDETRWGDPDRTYDDLSQCLWVEKKNEAP
jgi:uncharacterized protein YbjT (DUF2867 family)